MRFLRASLVVSSMGFFLTKIWLAWLKFPFANIIQAEVSFLQGNAAQCSASSNRDSVADCLWASAQGLVQVIKR